MVYVDVIKKKLDKIKKILENNQSAFKLMFILLLEKHKYRMNQNYSGRNVCLCLVPL